MKIYLNIIKAAKEIWYDNGMINRLEPEAEKVELLHNWLQTLNNEMLDQMELELSKLSDEDLGTVCCGEETEQERLASEQLNDFLNRIFDEEYEIRSGDLVEVVKLNQTIKLCGRVGQKKIGDMMRVLSVEGFLLKGENYNYLGKDDVKLIAKGEQIQ